MPLLEPHQKASLAPLVAGPEYSGLDDAVVAESLNAPRTVPNGPAPEIHLPFASEDLFGLLSSESAAKVWASPAITSFHLAILNQDRPQCRGWIGLAAVATVIRADEYQPLIDVLEDKGPDPEWPATVPAPSAFQALNLGPIKLPNGDTLDGTCTPEMVAEARN